jgi:uncharacterized protein (TIGR03000 family)
MRIARGFTALGLIALGFLVAAPGEATAFWGRHGCYGGFCYGPPPPMYFYRPVPICYGGCWAVPCYSAPGGQLPPYSPPLQQPVAPAVTPAKPASMTTSAALELDVPAEARVFVNDLATQTTGTHRRFVSPGLVPGLLYTYRVRVELPGKQQPIVETKTVKLQAGEERLLAFDLPAAEQNVVARPAPLPTSLTLHVPADAQVFLGGNPTTTVGTVRTYRTMLPAGERLDQYTVRVQLERDGKVVSREQTIALAAGEAREIKFDFAAQGAPALAASK